MKDSEKMLQSAAGHEVPDTRDELIGHLVENFGFYAIEVVRLMRRCFDHDLAAAGLNISPGEARALSFATAFPNERQKQLAERMGVEPMTFVGYIDSLADKGLVERVVDPSDRRANIIKVTTEAGPVVRKIAALNRQIRDSATNDLSVEDLSALSDLLLRLREAFGGMEAERRSASAQDRPPAARVGRPPRRGSRV